MNLLTQLAMAALILTAPAGAEACRGWHSVADRSDLQFIVNYEGADAPGTFRRFDVCLDFDPQHPRDGRLEVRVDVTSADMDSADINQAIADPEWFDTADYPQAQFTSNGITRNGDHAFAAHGTLTLKGVQQAVDVPFTWQSDGTGATMQGELVLQRTAFDIGTGEWSASEPIGHDVTVRFSVRLEAAR